jgi:hypothetical protein
LSDSDQLPLQVEIAVEGENWGETYLEVMTVRLDNEETQVRIELQTQTEPVEKTTYAGGASSIYQPPAPPSPDRGSRMPVLAKWIISLIILGVAAGIIEHFWPDKKQKKLNEIVKETTIETTSPQPYIVEQNAKENLSSLDSKDYSLFPDKSKIIFSASTKAEMIVFVRGSLIYRTEGDRFRIFIMNIDGSSKKEINPYKKNMEIGHKISHEDFVAPLLSPSGDKIAFSVTRNDHGTSIYVMDVDGNNAKIVTDECRSIAFGWVSDRDLFLYYNPWPTLPEEYNRDRGSRGFIIDVITYSAPNHTGNVVSGTSYTSYIPSIGTPYIPEDNINLKFVYHSKVSDYILYGIKSGHVIDRLKSNKNPNEFPTRRKRAKPTLR